MRPFGVSAALFLAASLTGYPALAQTRPPATAPADEPLPIAPPPETVSYLQYGVAFTAQFATQGAFCKEAQIDCVLGSGGGIAMRIGYRPPGPWYFGGSYEFSKQDSTKLYKLGILQQLRFEARYYIDTGREAQPFFAAGLGVGGYGDEWSVNTWGPAGYVAGGLEVQLDRSLIVGFSLSYRPIYFQEFQVSAQDENRGPGFAHMIALELTLEARDPL